MLAWFGEVGGTYSPDKIFSRVQKLYAEQWCEKFRWDQARNFLTTTEDVLNSQTLCIAGRSPVDSWANREKNFLASRLTSDFGVVPTRRRIAPGFTG